MRTILLIPDSFKGTMSSARICTVMERALTRHLDASVRALPVADGGEGTVEAFLTAQGGRRVELKVTGPMGETVTGFYGVLSDGTVVVEMAAAAGLPLVKAKLSPERTTTYGVGELLVAGARASLAEGSGRLIVGLGGSATTDMGAGAAAAAGVRFLDADGVAFQPCSGTLARIDHIDATGLDPALRRCRISVMCDIDNPLFGPRGAAHVFGPQKGAGPALVEVLDQGLRQASAVVERDLGCVVADLPGAGAAGGMGAGMVAFFGASLLPGIDVVLDSLDFDHAVQDTDLIITGEGRLDAQSLAGKVVIGVARRARTFSVPVIAVVGDIADGIDAVYDQGVTAVYSINHQAIPLAQAKTRAEADLDSAMDNIARTLAATGWAPSRV